MKKINLNDIAKEAALNGLKFNYTYFIDEEVELSSMLPSSEHDELMALDLSFSKDEDRYNYAAMEYFDRWPWEYNGDYSRQTISGFCNSIIDKLIIGKYMSDKEIPYALLYLE